jgi:uncharacterized SAM-binding protein YcdF (DUF218 family)
VWHGLINALVTPPGLLLVPLGIGLALTWFKPRWGIAIITVSWAGLTLFSLPVVATSLTKAWEIYPALTNPLPKGPRAIVVLAAGRYRKAPEYGGRTTVGIDTLVRLRYAARLFRESHLPILTSGGAPLGGPPAAVLMRKVLRRDFKTPVKWVEDRSQTTAQNARYSASILLPLGFREVFLVTQAWHMRRAVLLFRQAGFTVVPAPTDFVTKSRRSRTILSYLPSAHAIALSAKVVHEWVGVLWVHLQSLLPHPLARAITTA